MMRKLLSLLFAGVVTLLALTMLPAGPAFAAGEDAFLADAGAGSQSGFELVPHAQKKTAALGSAVKSGGGWLGRVGTFFKENGKLLRKIGPDALEEMLEVGGALLDGDLGEATVQFVGGIANVLIDQGVPLLAGAACSAFGTPAVGVVCYRLAKAAIEITGVDEWVERKVEDAVRRIQDDDDDEREQSRRRRDDDDDDRQRDRAETYDGSIEIDVITDDVTTTAGAGSTAVTDIGVARGGNVVIDARVDGTVNTNAQNDSSAYTAIGVAEGDDARLQVDVDGGVSTTAKNDSTAYTGIGVTGGGGGKVTVDVDGGVTTSATNRASASTEIGYANDGTATVRVDGGVNTIAKSGGEASTEIGTAEGGRVTVSVGDGVTTSATGSGSAKTVVGTSSGGNVNVNVGGSVNTISRGGANTSTNIGAGKSAFVGGDVLNKGGDLSIGGACRARRDGQCCIDIHRNLCVLQMTPTHKGNCPPRFERSGGMCYLYSDKKHRLDP